MRCVDAVDNWLFNTWHGRVLGICLIPVGLVVWLVGSMIIGDDLFNWLESKS